MRKIQYNLLRIFSSIFKGLYRNRLRVLAYHDVVDSELFELQIKYLRKNYSIVTIDQVRDNLLKKKPLPKSPLLLTFDDGDISVLEKGLPILVNNNCHACVFIITDLINTNVDFWFNTVRSKMKEEGICEKEINVKMNALKKASNTERIEKLKVFGTLSKKQLTESDLKLLIENNIFIGNHSHTHPMFNRCEPDEIISELNNVKDFFAKSQMEGYEVFAYPNGNWDENSERILREKNIELAFLFDHKVNSKKINPFRISRIRANSDMGINELKSKVSGLHSAIQILKKIK